jgi:transposase-like protein
MTLTESGTVRVSQPVLPMLPAQARSIGGSAGLLEGPDGGVVFVFGLATFSYAASDEAGRRLAAVQLVASKIATSLEVASAFGVSGVTLWKWGRDYTRGGVAALMRARTGPKGPINRRRAQSSSESVATRSCRRVWSENTRTPQCFHRSFLQPLPSRSRSQAVSS